MRVLVVALLLLMTVFAGCAKAPEPEPEPEPMPEPAPEPIVNETIEVVESLPWYPSDGTAVLEHLEVASFDGHLVPVTIHKPAIANATQQVPVLIHSHGFGGARTSTDSFTDYIAAGFGVVSFTQRGHGDAQEEPVSFMQPDVEVLDTKAVIDMIAELDWVLMENETTGDPYLGGIGGSYGGAFQMMGAIFDDRFDSLVPDMSWHMIAHALAPNGAPKSTWIDLFYLTGVALGTVEFNDDFHAGFAWLQATNELPAGQAPGVPDLIAQFEAASPPTYPGELDIPTLFTQGMKDTLFPLNDAVYNYHMVNATGAPTALYTHLSGHMLPGIQSAPAGMPCGTVTELGILWHQHHLLGLGTWDDMPNTCISFEDGSTLSGDQYPLNGTEMVTIDLGGPWPVPQAPAGAGIPFDLDIDGTVVGLPVLSGTITAGADAIIYASFRIPERSEDPRLQLVDDQAMPYRVKGPMTDAEFQFDMAGVAVEVEAGQLQLHISNWETQFFGNAERVPGAVVLDNLQLQVPVVR